MKQLLTKYFLPWRLFTFLVATIAVLFVPFRRDFNFLDFGRTWHNIAYLWSNFDGVHYLNIARYGYGGIHTQFTQAFFPLYPILIRFLEKLTGDYLSSGLLISHLSILGALYFLQKLIRLDFPIKTAGGTIWLLLLFPTAFFFVSVYTESLFLFLAVSSFYFARKGNFLLASLLAAGASATRVVGIFLLPVLLWEYWQANGKSMKRMFTVSGLVPWISTLGLLGYMNFLNKTLGDALYFIHVQPMVGAGRVISKVILLHQVFYRYLKMVIFVDHKSVTFSVVALELVVGILFLLLIFRTFKLRFSYGIYSLAVYLLPTLTGTFLSLPRFVLVIFPAFIVLQQFLSKQPRLRKLFVILCLLAQIYYLTLFATGNFVA